MRQCVSVLPPTDGPGKIDVDHGAGRRQDPDRAEAAGVLRDGRVGELQDGVVGRPVGDAERGVDGPLRLWRGAVVIDHDAVARDRHLDLDRVGFVFDPVVFHDVVEGVSAVRDPGDLGPHAPLGIIHQRVDMLAEGRGAVLAREVRHAALAEVDGGDQGAEVAVIVAGGADVGQHQPPDVVDVLPRSLDLDRGHAQPLVEHFRSLAREARRGHAADLADMADGDREADHGAFHEDRLEEGVLGRVQPAPVRVVVHQHVALLQLAEGDLLDARAQQQRHAADHGRAEIAGGDQLARRESEAAGEVERLTEDGRIGCPHERHAHVAAHRNQDASDDVQRHHVHEMLPSDGQDAGAEAPASAMRRLPKRSTVRTRPGSSTVTEASSSTTAGPRMSWVARRSARA